MSLIPNSDKDRKVKMVEINARNKEEAKDQIKQMFKNGEMPKRVMEKAMRAIDDSKMPGVGDPQTSGELKIDARDTSDHESDGTCFCGHCNVNPDRKVIKSVPATEEEKALKNDMVARGKALKAEVKSLAAAKEKFWAMVRLRIPDGFAHDNLFYNEEKGEIEYLDDNQN